jgi:hypothetical protein
MSRIKLFLIGSAIAIGVGGALASRPTDICESQTQYFQWGTSYFPAGQYGTDYVCLSSAGVCTFYRPNPFSGYVPCRTGTFEWVGIAGARSKDVIRVGSGTSR